MHHHDFSIAIAISITVAVVISFVAVFAARKRGPDA
jgi:hypothetical protein